jgi:integrase/recombinase XerD
MSMRVIDRTAALQSFTQALNRLGYAQGTVGTHIRFAQHFLDWAKRKGARMTDLSDEWLERFSRHLVNCRCASPWSTEHAWRVGSVRGARRFLEHLQQVGIVVAVPKSMPQEPILLAGFKQWMRQHRGTCDVTLYNYSLPIRALLSQLGEDPAQFDARSLREFILERSQHCSWTAMQRCTTAVRSFVCYLIAEGPCPVGLEAAIPMLAHWRLSRLPRYFQPEEVEHLIASCDVATPIGKRDRAILLLLARLGLRAGDITHCQLEDIDWKGGWIHVCGKSRRPTRLPLTQEIGQAIVSYLKEARPQTTAKALFVTSRAPFRPFGSHCAVSVIVDKAIRRSGVKRPVRGAAHLLRHSVASNLLRQGSSMQDIAALLRHRSIETTQIYAKVDVTALRQIAQPWPQVQSC